MTWHKLCDVEELNSGTGREFLVAGRIVAAFRNGQQIYAIDGMCAHQGGPIAQGALDGQCVTCPWHGWQYDITTGVNLLTKKRMLECFPVDVRDKQVWVDVTGE
jgi:nitrite reductase/ring-hydroxylating ferredoxin subunit